MIQGCHQQWCTTWQLCRDSLNVMLPETWSISHGNLNHDDKIIRYQIEFQICLPHNTSVQHVITQCLAKDTRSIAQHDCSDADDEGAWCQKHGQYHMAIRIVMIKSSNKRLNFKFAYHTIQVYSMLSLNSWLWTQETLHNIIVLMRTMKEHDAILEYWTKHHICTALKEIAHCPRWITWGNSKEE